MTRKDFELIAEVLQQEKTWSLVEPAKHRACAQAFANHLTRTNPRFNREKFLKACGVE